MRAALASCDATLIAMEAARDGVELTDLTVTVDSESDFRGVLGVDDSVHAGPRAVRVCIEVAAANASDDQLHEIVERVEARSPVRDAVVRTPSGHSAPINQPTRPRAIRKPACVLGHRARTNS